MNTITNIPDTKLTQATALLDFETSGIQALVAKQGWAKLPEFERIGAVYDFVRNDIRFGYNRADDIPASEILANGYGQCNTKATLLMALLRAVGVPCRLHGFTIKKELQRGVVPELVYGIAPKDILHSWVEINFDGEWINLEGYILDDAYLAEIQTQFQGENLCGYGVGTTSLSNPRVSWTGSDTYIQQTGINNDFGVFATPDLFYKNHRQDFSIWKKLLYRHGIRHWMNHRVQRIRLGRFFKRPVDGLAIDTSATRI